MPNNVQTTIRLVLKGGYPPAEKQAEEFFTQFISVDQEPIEGKEPRFFDFNFLVPQPENIWLGDVGGSPEENLKLIESYGGLEAVKKAFKEGKRFPCRENPCLNDEQIKRFGMVNGLDWNHEHWGTKWGAYDCFFDFGAAEISFYTAWSVPEKIIRLLRNAALKRNRDIECEFGGELDYPGEYSEGLFMYWNAEWNDETGELERIGDPVDVHG